MQSRFEALENYTEEEEVVLIRNLYRPRANAEIEGVKIAPAAQEMAGVGVLLRYNRVMSVTKALPRALSLSMINLRMCSGANCSFAKCTTLCGICRHLRNINGGRERIGLYLGQDSSWHSDYQSR